MQKIATLGNGSRFSNLPYFYSQLFAFPGFRWACLLIRVVFSLGGLVYRFVWTSIKCENSFFLNPTQDFSIENMGAACCRGKIIFGIMIVSLAIVKILSPDQMMATCQHNMSQHCWAQHDACVWPPCYDVLSRIFSSTSSYFRPPLHLNLNLDISFGDWLFHGIRGICKMIVNCMCLLLG